MRTARVAGMLMTDRSARGGWLVVLLSAAVTVGPSRSSLRGDEPEETRLRTHVSALASPAFGGRSGAGARKSAEYIAEAFRALRLEPLFADSYFQDIPASGPGRPRGRNVGARLLGSDSALRDQWIVVSAHYDHLGIQGGELYPGADDNASGVAMMLEVARALARGPERPRRSLMFLGFDQEEIGLYGSRYFVEHPPAPLDRLALFLTADMIGRALGGVCEPYVFVMGTEHAPGLRPWIERAARNRPITVGLLGADLLMINRSDYGPFRAREIPFLFFSTGENPRYHTPLDTPETLNYAKLESISRIILDVVRQATDAETVPKWRPVPDHPLAEAVTIRDVILTFLENRDRLGIGAGQMYLMKNTLRNLNDVIARQAITPEERTAMVRMARLFLISVL